MKKYVQSFGLGLLCATFVLSIIASVTGNMLNAIFFLCLAIFILCVMHIK